jgi:hypothetical protein
LGGKFGKPFANFSLQTRYFVFGKPIASRHDFGPRPSENARAQLRCLRVA